jgi:hypothetical protein
MFFGNSNRGKEELSKEFKKGLINQVKSGLQLHIETIPM